MLLNLKYGIYDWVDKMSQLLLGISQEIWAGAILGAVIGAIVIPIVWRLIFYFRSWWKNTRPQNQLLGPIRLQEEKCRVFVPDYLIDRTSKLLSIVPRIGVGEVPNVYQLWRLSNNSKSEEKERQIGL
jgi:hypothetical protein